jgi:signal transduction histidine kinase
VNVRFELERIVVTVEDNGRGFQVPPNLGTLVSGGKLGLLGMQERAQLTGGSVALESHPGTGTLITIDIPA